ncbi:uncharacterized protein AB675_3144 [Cyphellophora attinorum]|uniref:Fungal N-terminal domain-containing protein n=1 Tax=Cyphellophora attinorum TaxID=1664694 RepID=A0A0N0NK90_9EURO|nr:uncharacterized protein AB675_3144 [Phialophora attinorum]KPI37871.1 hypothetical protein AB675_3144 [Phialophora attinorum]
MAEVVASVIGITTFGVKLVDTLYDFGCNVASAREQSSRIGDRVNDYVTILDILSGLLEDEASLVSAKAAAMVKKLCVQSNNLFHDIDDLVPRTKFDGTVAWLDRIKWNFRKPKTEWLLGQIEYIKTNVLLLVMTTIVGKRIRKRRAKKKSQQPRDDPDLQRQTRRAQNVIVQHINAGERLAALQKDLEQADTAETKVENASQALVQSSGQLAVVLMSRQVDAIARFQNSMVSYSDPASRQAYVMDKSPALLRDLLGEWTLLSGTSTQQMPRLRLSRTRHRQLAILGPDIGLGRVVLSPQLALLPVHQIRVTTVQCNGQPAHGLSCSRPSCPYGGAGGTAAGRKDKGGLGKSAGFGIRVKKEADKKDASEAAMERTKLGERSEKERRAEADRRRRLRHAPDVDNADHVTGSPKPGQEWYYNGHEGLRGPSGKNADYDSGDESDDSLARKWAAKFDKTRQYMEKAALGARSRPKFERHESGSYWSSHHRSGSDPDKYASSAKERKRRRHDDS